MVAKIVSPLETLSTLVYGAWGKCY